MDKVDTTQRGPATPIFDMLIAEVGLSWTDMESDAASCAAAASPADRNAPEG
ncbi:hypothetical protein ACIRSS_48035 [Amycolatopsis sp. NPDC101161]|uniref:hypothetical protein n=1 Tax=Amycolatopsis sp. NPDC101161 TaxID=3363940 RepID=UPI00380BE3AE